MMMTMMSLYTFRPNHSAYCVLLVYLLTFARLIGIRHKVGEQRKLIKRIHDNFNVMNS